MIKRLIYTLFIASLLSVTPIQADAQVTYVFEGSVTDENTMEPVWGHGVWVTNLDSTINDFGFTNEFGWYTLSLIMDSVPDSVVVSTLDCNGQLLGYVNADPQASNQHDFVVCTNNTACEAFYIYEIAQGSDPLAIQFIDQSFGATQWFWNFGDGTADTAQNPLHTFLNPGFYPVCLYIADPISNCHDTICMEIVVDEAMCEADFYYSIDSLDQSKVYFYDISTGEVDVWYWKFGDGTDSYEQSPIHEYAQSGEYTVCLQIFGDNGLCADSILQKVYVSIDSAYCQANFEVVLDTLNNTPYVYQFIDQSVSNGITTYFWDFGDGSTSLETNPIHTYDGPGPYNVCLFIETYDFCTSAFCETVETLDYYNFGGQVFMGDFPLNIDPGDSSNTATASLYRKFDHSWKLMETTAFWEYGYYVFLEKPVGEYLVRIDLNKSSSDYGAYIPTYYTHATDWKSATTFRLSNSLQFAANIQFSEVHPMIGGIGQLSGYLSGDFSCFVEGDFNMDEVLVKLYNAENQLVLFAYTDPFGSYFFSGLPPGNYTVQAEYTGLYSPVASVSINDLNPVISELELVVYCSHPTGVTESSSSILPLEILSVYPLPASDVMYISVNATLPFKAQFSLTDMLGRTVMEGKYAVNVGAQTLSIPIHTLNSGLHIINLYNSEGARLHSKKILINY